MLANICYISIPPNLMLCRIIPTGSMPADNKAVRNSVCGSLRYDLVDNRDGALKIHKFKNLMHASGKECFTLQRFFQI